MCDLWGAHCFPQTSLNWFKTPLFNQSREERLPVSAFSFSVLSDSDSNFWLFTESMPCSLFLRWLCSLSPFYYLAFNVITILELRCQSAIRQQKCILSQVWRTDVGIQGVGRAAIPLEVLGEHHSVPLPASGGCCQSSAWGSHLHPLLPSAPGLLRWVCLSLFLLLFLQGHQSCWIRDLPTPIGLHLNLYLNGIFKDPISK